MRALKWQDGHGDEKTWRVEIFYWSATLPSRIFPFSRVPTARQRDIYYLRSIQVNVCGDPWTVYGLSWAWIASSFAWPFSSNVNQPSEEEVSEGVHLCKGWEVFLRVTWCRTVRATNQPANQWPYSRIKRLRENLRKTTHEKIKGPHWSPTTFYVRLLDGYKHSLTHAACCGGRPRVMHWTMDMKKCRHVHTHQFVISASWLWSAWWIQHHALMKHTQYWVLILSKR